MKTHTHSYKDIRGLRSQGLTYAEINQRLGTTIPKSSLTYICKNITLSEPQQVRIRNHNIEQVNNNRLLAVAANRKKQQAKRDGYRLANNHLVEVMESRDVKLIALAMLYLGEGAKWKSHRGMCLANTNPDIIITYLRLLKDCFGVNTDNLHCSVQHRADQKSSELVKYWSNVTGIPTAQFYACYTDKRTTGSPTKKTDYKGVCKIIGPGTAVQLELEQIAGIIGKALGHWRSW